MLNSKSYGIGALNTKGFGVAAVPDFSWGDLNLAGSTLQQLSDEEKLARKKKIMAAGASGGFQGAMSMLFGNRLNSAGTPMA